MRKSLHILLMAFWFVWTAIIIPVHRPGVVQMAGAGQVACGNFSTADEGCPLCRRANTPAKSGQPSKPAASCAICDFKAKLNTPTVFVFDLAPRGLAQVATQPRVIDAPALRPLRIFSSRAPPALA